MDPVLATLRASVLTAQRSELSSSWGRAGGIDPYGRLYFIESGSAFVQHHRRRYEMRRDGFYLIPAGTDVALGCAKRVVIRWCHFTATVLGGIDLFAYLSCAYETMSDDPARIADLFDRLVEVHASVTSAEQVQTVGILLELLTPFIATARPAEKERARARIVTFRQVLEYVEQHIEEPMRVGDLAATAGYQTAYFSRAFKRAFGIGPAAYVIRKKIETAQRLMIETDGTLQFIADRLSFTDAFHLSKTFRRVTGMTPSEFKETRRTVQP